jgi:hypothetical protein
MKGLIGYFLFVVGHWVGGFVMVPLTATLGLPWMMFMAMCARLTIALKIKRGAERLRDLNWIVASVLGGFTGSLWYFLSAVLIKRYFPVNPHILLAMALIPIGFSAFTRREHSPSFPKVEAAVGAAAVIVLFYWKFGLPGVHLPS